MDILLPFWYFYIVYICVRYSNVNVVYIWFKHKDYMLYVRLKLYHVLLNYKTDSEFLSSVIFIPTNSSFLLMDVT